MERFGFNINLKNSPEDILTLGETMLGTGLYHAIEVTHYENMEDTDTFAYNQAIRQIVTAYRPQVLTHISGFNLSEECTTLRAAILQEVDNCCQYTARLGGKEIVIHTGLHSSGLHVPIVGPDGSRGTREDAHARCWDLSVRLMRRACDIAAEYGITLYTENLNMNLLTQDCETLGRFIDAVGRANLAIVFDVGHCHHTGHEVVPDVIAAGTRLKHLHLHDNHGKTDEHLPLGEGTIDYAAFARALRTVGYTGLYMMELYRCTPENLRRCRDLLLQY